MTIVLFVKKETEVGIMIVLQLMYAEDMEVESLFSGGNEENLELGNITEKHNGNETKDKHKTKTVRPLL